MYTIDPLRPQREESLPVNPTSQYCLRARPGRGFAFRPMCKVIALRGRYQGCGDFEGCTDPLQACEVLLEYPVGLGNNNAEGTQKWHYGPVGAPGWSGETVVDYELTLGAFVDRMDRAWRIVTDNYRISGKEPFRSPILRHELEAAKLDIYDAIEAVHHFVMRPHAVGVTEIGRGYDLVVR